MYTTFDEAVDREIVEPIESGGVVEDAYAEYDIDKIADEVLVWNVNPNRPRCLNVQGFSSVVTPDEFWEIVQRHEKTNV